jgi:cyclophilin family peptidyl-prolyl cis-trans isomerase/protein-disulfide isomerase
MKKILIFLLLLLAACGSAQPPTGDQNELNGQGFAVEATPAAETIIETALENSIPPSAAEVAGVFPATSPAEAAVVRSQDWPLGAANPIVSIIEYGDFQWPGCAGFASLLKRLVDAYPEHVQIIYRHFPLNQIHPNAQKSAEAAEAAGAQGQFWPYHDLLFERQSAWSGLNQNDARQYFIELAAELGLDVARFTAELDEGVYANYVSAMEQEAVNLGLPGTPSVLVDGQIAAGNGLPRDYAVWDSYVMSAIMMAELAARQYDSPPPIAIDPQKRYLATVQMANGAEFVIELLPKSAPQTVNSFVTFHRVLPGFVAQTGDPTGTGRGGPGYTIPNEVDPALSHDVTGMVAMANSGPDTNGSQWYVTLGDASFLDGGYTIFGRVITGLEVVQRITPRDPQVDPGAPPGDTIVTISINVMEQ